MTSAIHRDLLRQLPSVNDLLADARTVAWLAEHPRELVTDCLRTAVDTLREQILSDQAGRCGVQHVNMESVLDRAEAEVAKRTSPNMHAAINATGIILHTGLGRAVLPARAVEAIGQELKGYVTLAVDRETGERINRDQMVESLLCELTGAEAATVVNNNAAGTMLVLAALGAGREVIVSRGELIEIGGAFRLPDVMAQSQSKMVEVGTTNRTHLRDYENAMTEDTSLLFRAHPSNYRIVGFTSAVPIESLAELAHGRGLAVVDDLGAGALVGLEKFGLPHEPTMRESIEAGADIVLASTDKLIGAGQGGVIVGKKELIKKIRKHPLARAMRVDKTCLMALERTLPLFRDIKLLKREHPTYMMLSSPMETLTERAEALAAAIRKVLATAEVEVCEDVGYLGSGSLPSEALPSMAVRLRVASMKVAHLAKALRLDDACVFTRVTDQTVVMDTRTITDEQVELIAAAVKRCVGS